MIRFFEIGAVLLLTIALSCGQDTPRGVQGTGGVSGTGGVLDIGGIQVTGGVSGSGGVSDIGGDQGTGGVSETGGRSAMGGATPGGGTTVVAGGTTGGGVTTRGGSSGATSSGGTGAGGRTRTGRTGGTSTSGGATASGGTSTAGGATASGGVSTSGGATASGGAAAPLADCTTAPLRTSGTVHYFCSNGGSDSNDGLSSSTPKASWSVAISTFNSIPAGDTVALCRGGSWTASTSYVNNRNCRADNTCDFRDYGTGNLPVISFNGPAYDHLFTLDTPGHDEGYRWWNIDVENVSGKEIDWFFHNDVSDVDICNIVVNGGALAIQDQGGDVGQARNNRFTVRNSAFSNISGQGLLVQSSNFTVDSNVFMNIGDSTACGMFCHAIYFQEDDIGERSETHGMEAQNLRIINNKITMDSSVACGSEMIHIAGRQNNGLVENNYMSAVNPGETGCQGISATGSGYQNAAWFRAMTYRRNRIFLLGNSGPTQVGIVLDGHGTVASDVNGQSVYTLNQAVPPAIVADNIIVLGGAYPQGLNYQTNTSGASPAGDVTSGIITYNNSIYFPNAKSGSVGITTEFATGNNYVVQNNAVYAPSGTCIDSPNGFLAGRNTPNYCRTASGATNGLSSDALGVVWTDAANGDFSLPAGSPLIGAGNPTYYDPYAVAPTEVKWTAVDLPETRVAAIDIGAVSSH